MVVAQCFRHRGVNCKRTGAGLPPPHPAPSADGLKRTPAAVHPLPQGGEGKSRVARKSQQKCGNSKGRGLPQPRPSRRGGGEAALRLNWDTTNSPLSLPELVDTLEVVIDL